MNDLPPKSVKVQLVRLDDSLKRIERSQFSGIQRAPGSLPVLEAFQLFLENERQRARKRILWLTTGAILLMVVAAVAGVALVHSQMRKATAEISLVSSRTDELEAAIASTEKQNADDITALENRFSEESRRIVAQYSAMLTEQTAIADQVRSGGATLETLQERLERLESENEILKTRLASLPLLAGGAGVPATDARPSGTLATTTPEDMPRESLQPPHQTIETVTDATAVALPAVTVIEHPTVLLLTIVPAGQPQGIRWQLPHRFIQE